MKNRVFHFLPIRLAIYAYGKPNGQKMKNTVFRGKTLFFIVKNTVFHSEKHCFS